MAQEGLPLARKLCKCKGFPFRNKNGVVSKTGGSPGLPEDVSLADSFDHDRRARGAHEREHAAKSRAPFPRRRALQRVKEAIDILAIARVRTREARGVKPGRTLERVHLEAGIVSQRGSPERVVRGARLRERVLAVGGPGFGRKMKLRVRAEGFHAAGDSVKQIR